METAAPQDAARALLAFWRAAGVDMDEAEAVFAAKAATASPARGTAAPSPLAREPFQIQPPTPKAKPKAKLQPADDAVNTAKALAAGASTVAELRAAVDKFNGCALKATARNTVFSDGIDAAPVLILGEAPGKDEDEQGKPFVGRSGQMLDKMLGAIGLDRQSNVLISNTIYWRPPGNRDPTDGETLSCLPFVERLIELSKPKLLILTGKAAAQTVLKREDGVMKLRGRKLQYTREGIKAPVNAMVMLHPAYLLRQPQQKRLAWADLLLAEAWLEELGVARGAHP
ncbi:MAG: uracil-DNA glycosylase [Alphaproteobacteria bacterium]|nr:uracil-DNA glycosylase [Alphaproteobacteria bacterium]